MLDFNYLFWAALISFIILSHISMAKFYIRRLCIELIDGFMRVEGRTLHVVLATYTILIATLFIFILIRKTYYLAFIL